MLRRIYLACLVAYSMLIASVTLRSLPLPNGTPDLVPFVDTWSMMRDIGQRAALREVAGNFCLFVPLGFLLAASFSGRLRLVTVIAAAALASVAIEGAQLLLVAGRNPSIDDVIYNSAGAAVGAVVFSLLHGAFQFRRTQSTERSAQAGS